MREIDDEAVGGKRPSPTVSTLHVERSPVTNVPGVLQKAVHEREGRKPRRPSHTKGLPRWR